MQLHYLVVVVLVESDVSNVKVMSSMINYAVYVDELNFRVILRNISEYRCTFETVVVGFEKRLQVVARASCLERRIRHAKLTLTPAGAALIGEVQHVRRAAEVSHVDGDTAVEPHPAVVGRLHHDHLVFSTSCPKDVVHAVFRRFG